jgi:hypothetical protein
LPRAIFPVSLQFKPVTDFFVRFSTRVSILLLCHSNLCITLLIEQSAPLKAAWRLQQQRGVTRTGESRPHPHLLSLLSVPPPRGLLRGVLAGYAM